MTDQSADKPAARVRKLIAITESLSDILARENEALEARRPGEILPLQSEKARLAAAYAQAIREVALNRRIVDGADPSLLDELREITEGFEARAARQRALLDAAIKAGESVVRAVADEAADQDDGAYADNARKGATALSINERA